MLTKDYAEFKKIVLEVFNNDKELCTYQISIEDVYKNNRKLDGLRFFKHGIITTPVFYLEDFYDDYVDVDGMIYLSDILDTVKNALKKCIQDNTLIEKQKALMSFIEDKNSILNNVELCVRDARNNKQLVQNIPHRHFLDLIVYYQVALSDSDNGDKMSIKITNDMTNRFNITEEELFYHAICNLGNANNYAMGMIQVINSIYGLPFEKAYSCEDLMVVLNNESGINASNNIFNIGLLDEVAKEFDSDLYILPSSIHELILVPKNTLSGDNEDIDSLKDMVSSINSTEVSAGDKLTDSVYTYIRAIKRVELV